MTREEIVKAFRKIRIEAGLTQIQLSKKMMTSQSRVSFFESGAYTPSLDWLVRYAFSCEKTLHISFEEK